MRFPHGLHQFPRTESSQCDVLARLRGKARLRSKFWDLERVEWL
jgi:hypothetical protein